jgi:hypothetical protein
MQVEQKGIELGQILPIEVDESDAHSLFIYAMSSPVTKDYYLRRLQIFSIILTYFREEQ